MTLRKVVDDLNEFLGIFPPHIKSSVRDQPELPQLIEVILDLGRKPEARFPHKESLLSNNLVTREDLESVVAAIGDFGVDNRAGIEGTLHRISCIRNRMGLIVGLTCRVGRAIYGTVDIVRDIVESGKSSLLLGPPGLGKTTKLREIARVLSDELKKRVIVVDTSNEIAGDGDIPHPAIGNARRMQVRSPEEQRDVMIEAVENHMPEAVIIDEIGREEETSAARTIAERGVQLIATAHGNTLQNLVANPMLCNLVGGVQAVTLGDEEARRRSTQKTVLEREATPTFDVVIEMLDRERIAIHHDTAKAVDTMLRGNSTEAEVREELETGEVLHTLQVMVEPTTSFTMNDLSQTSQKSSLSLLPYGVSRNHLERAAINLNAPINLVKRWQDADVVLTLRSHARRERGKLEEALRSGKEVFAIRSNTYSQIESQLREILGSRATLDETTAVNEAKEAVNEAIDFNRSVRLIPRAARLRRLQHRIAEEYNLKSESIGSEPHRRVIIRPTT